MTPRLRWVLGGLAALAALAVLLVGYYVLSVFQVWRAARADDARPSDAIVVLGAAQYDGRPSPAFAARLDHAHALYEQGIAPLIVVTGGKQPGDRFTEAAVGADYLIARGVPDAVILRETTSHSSWESLQASARFLFHARHPARGPGLGSVPLAAHPSHCGGDRFRRGDLAHTHEPDPGCRGVATLPR